MSKFMYRIGFSIGKKIGLAVEILVSQKFIGFLLFLPSFMVILSMWFHPGDHSDMSGYDSGWNRYFFRHLWRTADGTMTGQPIPEQSLSISLIIIAMIFAGAYLFKSSNDKSN